MRNHRDRPDPIEVIDVIERLTLIAEDHEARATVCRQFIAILTDELASQVLDTPPGDLHRSPGWRGPGAGGRLES